MTPTSDTERSSEQSWVSRDSTGVFVFVGKVRDDIGEGDESESERCHIEGWDLESKMVLGKVQGT